jgi:RNA polymerase-binding transcription factor DksA
MNTNHFKDLLYKEQERLIESMKTIGQLSEIVPGHWETHTDKLANKELEPDALADKYEDEATNEGVLETLEERLKEVTDALERISAGTYGKCMICGNKIEVEKLEANPATPTCMSCTNLA